MQTFAQGEQMSFLFNQCGLLMAWHHWFETLLVQNDISSIVKLISALGYVISSKAAKNHCEEPPPAGFLLP
jgi:hypothetical protein